MKHFLFIFCLFLFSGCGEINQSVFIDSYPQGAQILNAEGDPLGVQTPAYVEFPIEIESHLIYIDRPGYRRVPAYFNRDVTTEFMSPGKAAPSLICAPCCCGLPLLNFLDPVDINKRFVPQSVQVNLERTGGGVHLRVFPPTTEILIDGVSRGQILSDQEVFIKIPPGEHQIKFQAEGFEGDVVIEKVLIDPDTEVRLNVKLEPVTGGLFIKKTPANILKHIQIYDQDNKDFPVMDVSVAPEDWVIHQLPAGRYEARLRGQTTSGKVISHSVPFQVNEKKLTTLDISTIDNWKEIRPWLGILIGNDGIVKSSQKSSFVAFLTFPKIQDVFSQSPAARAGLRPGDIILAVNGESLGQAVKLSQVVDKDFSPTQNLVDFIGQLDPGDPLLIILQRDDEIVHIKINALGSITKNEVEITHGNRITVSQDEDIHF